MPIPTLPGITARTISTDRLSTRVLFSGPDGGTPVLFIHGNTSCATWWEETMLALPPGFRGIAPDQRGYGQADPAKKIDATRGLGDLADDAVALLDHLGISQAHVVGSSLGGSVIWHLLMEHPARFLTVTQAAPGSPYGFGGTKDRAGTPSYDDFAGSGGGLVSPELIRRIQEGDRTADSPFSPLSALRTLIVKPPLILPREEDLLSGMLATHIGPQDTPGDALPSPNWPGLAPGVWGAANALSPKYVRHPDALHRISPKPPILWIRGSHDLLVSNTAASDVGYLGKAGLIPGWPGEEVFPPQPMLDQTRAVLERYQSAGGRCREVVMADVGHVPYLEKPQQFSEHLNAWLTQ